MYLQGENVPKNTEKGQNWLRIAARNSEIGAMKVLGECYAEGLLDSPCDLKKAIS